MREGIHKVKAVVKNKQVVPINKERFEKILEQYEGQLIDLYIDEFREAKTANQLGYYFAIIEKICTQMICFAGWHEEEIDDFFRSEFLSLRFTKALQGNMKTIFKMKTISKLSKKEMAEFITNVITYINQEGVEVFEPDQLHLIKKYGKGN